ncbi:MAG TPA: glycoside hydrolase family 15 protein [Mycobacteriales bacterium]|nr:glycoside hydrolase family 15 protein [Mycobacteriales bacterium]
MKIEDYAVIGDTQTAALVGRDGSIDWLCLPRFDSPACFAALLGGPENGRWLLAPMGDGATVRRRYIGDSLVLETTFRTSDGEVRLLDLMPVRGRAPDVVRVVEGVSGRVRMRCELTIRFDYGRSVPWVRRDDGRLRAVAGPDALLLETPVELGLEDGSLVAEVEVSAGDRVPFVLTWFPSYEETEPGASAEHAVDDTVAWWQEWADRSKYDGEWRDAVVRSLVTLKALTYAPTGGIVAAATTSLPEQLGGVRNWDYRICWLRDATFTLYALLSAGHTQEALAWRDWLLRAVAGAPKDMQIMYGIAGERMLPEVELPWLSGYEGARPVRVGNAAVGQFQLDVYGEVMDCMFQARRDGLPDDVATWAFARSIMDHLESSWQEPDEGIWEVRGPRRQFTHSKVMAWVAADRAVKTVEQFGGPGPVDRWRQLREDIHKEVLEKGWNSDRQAFTQFYGGRGLDAALLMMPLVGFLPPEDERVRGTLAAIEAELCVDGFVRRYGDAEGVDGLPPGEGAFLPCTFWLADSYALAGRHEEARATFERLLALSNDVGLLSEEYDVSAGRLVGNFPQAFTHVSLVNTAQNLARGRGGPGRLRAT